ncbi:MAG: 4-hydroxy-3-methylbut-2-enyl diphosphate reductase [Desulfobacteraceae bacterium]|nr:MAG: 4-hydroxy-3-methylbut-2-enyl diphosphate reductase [Desulfobacteraceae bacterium]
MKIMIAKTAGFCMGVRRAVEMALDAPAQHAQPIFTYGPLIHNPQVLAMFGARGITVLDNIPSKGSGTVLVRAHGVPPATKQQLKQAGFTVIDATCPRVVKVQSIIKRHARKNHAAIIVGDQDHPEVISLLGFAGKDGYAVGTLEALKQLPPFEQAIVVAQTTQNEEMYRQVKAWTAEHRPHYKVFDTICDSTEKRQAEVRRLAQEVDAVVVVGGKNSGNTRRLAEIVTATGRRAFHVETEAELDMASFSGVEAVGITAGASTPTWIIKRVVRAIEQMPTHGRLGWRSLLLRMQRFLLLTNIYVALGAGCLSFAATQLQHLAISLPALSAAVLYVISMHILNHLTGRAEDSYNDPDRERFYSRHKLALTAMALSAGALGLVAAFHMGLLAFWTLLAMSVLGLSYNLRLIPDRMLPGFRFRRIRDLPGSKTILIALAWGVVTAGLPALADPAGQFISGALAVVWAAGLAFTRTAVFDILDMQGDRIVGKETIPILLGPERALLLLKTVLSTILILLCVAAWAGIFSSLAFLLTLAPAFLWAIIVLHKRGSMLAGTQLEFMVESLFILTGIMTFFYALVR